MRRNVLFLFASLFAILAVTIVAVPPAHSDDVSHARIVRLSFVEGDVAYQRPGSPWQRANMNLPVQQDFSLRTDAGYAEVEFDGGLMVRLAPNTQIEFPELSLIAGAKVTSLKLDKGTIITTTNISRNDQVSIASGNLNVTVAHSGRFRMDASEIQNFVTAFHGKVDVVNGSSTTELESGKTLHFGVAEGTSTVDRNQPLDAFDKWVAQRDDAQQMAQSGAGEFTSQRNYAYSTGDLYNYGLWYNVSGYGMLWQPYGVDSLWMPFGNGMWMFGDPGFGWMWNSFEPWGWLPYHYGGWVNIAGQGWFWAPQNLGTFLPANANFVNVGNQVGWTPNIAPPLNPNKVKVSMAAQTQVVFAGAASNGVIVAGLHGQLASGTTAQSASSPAPTFAQQASPARAILAASGVAVIARAPARSANMNPSLAYAPRSASNTSNGAPNSSAGANSSARTNLNANLSAPAARPAFLPPPHSSPMPVAQAPSTFANSSNSANRSSGFSPVGSSSSANFGGSHGGAAPSGASGAQGAQGANSGAHSGAPASSAPSSSSGSAVHH
jgi:hypothetical protein